MGGRAVKEHHKEQEQKEGKKYITEFGKRAW